MVVVVVGGGGGCNDVVGTRFVVLVGEMSGGAIGAAK